MAKLLTATEKQNDAIMKYSKATGLPAASNATSAVTGVGPGNTAVVDGTVTFSANSTIQLQFASEEYQKIN